MDIALFRILYCSRNLISDASGRPVETLNSILEKSRRNNGKNNVTGALLYSSGFFAQVLEGPKTSIEEAFERIQRDPRHAEVTVLECGEIQDRDFPAWSMAHVEPHSEAQATGASTALNTAMDDPDAARQDILQLLRTLVVQED